MANALTMKLVQAKLEESGLSLEDGKALGLTYHDDLKALDEVFDPVPGIRFEYRDVFGQPYEARPGWGMVWRARQLEIPSEEKSGFDKNTTGKKVTEPGKKPKDRRYLQPAGSVAAPYYPSILVNAGLLLDSIYDEPGDWTGWAEVALDTTVPIIITEGEFKAAKCCKEGMPTIGLGGVWNFKSVTHGYAMLPGLKDIEWKKRRVNIIYDSDVKDNPNMLLSIREVSEQLYKLGAMPYCVFLPALGEEGKKTGLDDFLVHPEGGTQRLLEIIESCQDMLELTRDMWRWNDNYIHVTLNPHCIVDRKTGQAYKKEEWASAHQTEDLHRKVLHSDGTFSLEATSLGSEIFKWPLHSRVNSMRYVPGEPPLQVINDGEDFNVWPGWGCQPVQGDMRVYHELVDHIFGDRAAEAKWYLKWVAYQLQHPGVKLNQAVLITGVHGAGKSLLAEGLRFIFGENFSEVDGPDNFFGQFNEWAAKKQFVLANEVIVKGDRDQRVHTSALKNFVTRKEVTINEKYGLKYKIKDSTNIFMTANPMDSLPLENGERRYFIFRSEAAPLQTAIPGFLTRWDNWKVNGGPEALFYYLLNQVDTSDFDPHGHAMETESRADVLDAILTDAAVTVRDIMENGPEYQAFRLPGDLWTVKRLFAFLNEDQRRYFGGSPAKLKKTLIEQGCISVDGGTADRRLKYDGHNEQYWAIRNQAEWKKARPDDMRAHLEEFESAIKDVKGKF